MAGRTSLLRRTGIVAVVVAFVSTGLFVDARAEDPTGPTMAGVNHQCGDLDNQEPGIQGDVPLESRVQGPDGISAAERGFNCGLALVGSTTLYADGRDGSDNANMAVSQDCAYVSSTGGVETFGPDFYEPADDAYGIAVVDVSEPETPVHVKTLKGSAGSTKTSETIYAIDAPARPKEGFRSRHLLVVGQYGNAGSGVLKPMDIYDVSEHTVNGVQYNCANPEFLTTYEWPDNIHNLTISGNGRYVFATQPLQMLDLDPLFREPRGEPDFVGNIELDMPYPLVPLGPGPDADDDVPAPVREANRRGYSSHQAWSNADGTLLHLGAQTPQYEVFTIVDLTDWLKATNPVERATIARPRVVRQQNGRGHSVNVGTIEEHGTWAVHAEESVILDKNDCADDGLPLPATHTVSPNYGLDPFLGVAEPFLSDVSDPETQAPRMHVSRLGLAINRIENCDAINDSGVAASVHYHELDRERDARFLMASMQNAGLRVFDIQDPEHPAEVAYFNPGDVDNGDGVTLDYAWGHPHFHEATNQIWFATAAGGFWVVELEAGLLDHLGMATAGDGPIHPNGSPGRAGVVLNATLPALIAPAYCTLGRPA